MPKNNGFVSLSEHDKRNMTKLERAIHATSLVWMIIGILLLLVVAGIILGSIWPALMIILLSAFIVFVLNPGVNFFERHRLSRPIGSLIMFIAMFAVLAALTFSIIPSLIEQISGIVKMLPTYYQELSEWFTDIRSRYADIFADPTISAMMNAISQQVSNALAGLASMSFNEIANAGSEIASAFVVMSVSLVVSFWILLDYHRMAHEMHILVGPRYDNEFTFVTTVCSRVLTGYIKGTLIGCLCVGVLSGIGYWICGIPYAAVLGLLTGVFTVVPYLGPVIAGIVVALFALFNGFWACVLSVLISCVAQWIVATFISPRIMSSTVSLHPCIVLVVLIAGGALGGVFGMLVAIPVTAIVKDIFVYYFEKKTGRQLVGSDGALFKGKPSVDVDPVSDATDQFITTSQLQMFVDGSCSGFICREDPPDLETKKQEKKKTTASRDLGVTGDGAPSPEASVSKADDLEDKRDVFDWLDT
jgi:predicted PurR-regulated permease PerM